MINIVCVLKCKNSLIYNEEWVYKLERSIARNLSIPYKFICLTDTELTSEYALLDENFEGWWNKLQLFKPGLFIKETLYFDLDVIITKPLDDLIKNIRQSKVRFLMCKELSGTDNSSIMYWKGSKSSLYKKYIKNPTYYQEKYKDLPLLGDQAFISKNIKHGFIEDYLPVNYIAWTDAVSLNNTDETGLVVFTSIKSKPSKSTFINHPIIKNHWI